MKSEFWLFGGLLESLPCHTVTQFRHIYSDFYDILLLLPNTNFLGWDIDIAWTDTCFNTDTKKKKMAATYRGVAHFCSIAFLSGEM